MRAGDVVTVDFGVPLGSEAGMQRPAIVVNADEYLTPGMSTVTVVPVTSATHRYESDVPLAPGIETNGVAQCRLVTTVSTVAVDERDGENVGPVVLRQIRAVLGDLLDIG